MEDIQTWWEIPSIAHFCSLFRAAFNLLDFDIEDLEQALLEGRDSVLVGQLLVRLLQGCLPEYNVDPTSCHFYLQRLLRFKCLEDPTVVNPLRDNKDFYQLSLRKRVVILQLLCDLRLESEDVIDLLKNLEADSLRVEPLGHDDSGLTYWYFYGTRLYKESVGETTRCRWQCVCHSADDWLRLARLYERSHSPIEQQLYRTLKEDFLPEIPRLFSQKEKLQKKRLLEMGLRRQQPSRVTPSDVTSRPSTVNSAWSGSPSPPVSPSPLHCAASTAHVQQGSGRPRRRGHSGPDGGDTDDEDAAPSHIAASASPARRPRKRRLSAGQTSSDERLVEHALPVGGRAVKRCRRDVEKPKKRPKEEMVEVDSEEERLADQARRTREKEDRERLEREKEEAFIQRAIAMIEARETSAVSDNRRGRSRGGLPNPGYTSSASSGGAVRQRGEKTDKGRRRTPGRPSSGRARPVSPPPADAVAVRAPVPTKASRKFVAERPAPSAAASDSDSDREVADARLTARRPTGPKKTSSGVVRRRSGAADESAGDVEYTPTGTHRRTADSTAGPDARRFVGRRTNNSLGSLNEPLSALDDETDGAAESKESQTAVVKSDSCSTKIRSSAIVLQTDEELRVGMYKVLEAVKSHDDAWPFLDPVEEEYAPNYYAVIRRPMDLNKMESRLDAGVYTSRQQLEADFKLIVDNCKLYNGLENEYTDMVLNIDRDFHKFVRKYLGADEEEEEDIYIDVSQVEHKSRRTSRDSFGAGTVAPGGKKRGRKPKLSTLDSGGGRGRGRGRRRHQQQAMFIDYSDDELLSSPASKPPTREDTERLFEDLLKSSSTTHHLQPKPADEPSPVAPPVQRQRRRGRPARRANGRRGRSRRSDAMDSDVSDMDDADFNDGLAEMSSRRGSAVPSSTTPPRAAVMPSTPPRAVVAPSAVPPSPSAQDEEEDDESDDGSPKKAIAQGRIFASKVRKIKKVEELEKKRKNCSPEEVVGESRVVRTDRQLCDSAAESSASGKRRSGDKTKRRSGSNSDRGPRRSGDSERARGRSGDFERARGRSGDSERVRGRSGDSERALHKDRDSERALHKVRDLERSRGRSGDSDRVRRKSGGSDRVRRKSGDSDRARRKSDDSERAHGRSGDSDHRSRDKTSKKQRASSKEKKSSKRRRRKERRWQAAENSNTRDKSGGKGVEDAPLSPPSRAALAADLFAGDGDEYATLPDPLPEPVAEDADPGYSDPESRATAPKHRVSASGAAAGRTSAVSVAPVDKSSSVCGNSKGKQTFSSRSISKEESAKLGELISRVRESRGSGTTLISNGPRLTMGKVLDGEREKTGEEVWEEMVGRRLKEEPTLARHSVAGDATDESLRLIDEPEDGHELPILKRTGTPNLSAWFKAFRAQKDAEPSTPLPVALPKMINKKSAPSTPVASSHSRDDPMASKPAAAVATPAASPLPPSAAVVPPVKSSDVVSSVEPSRDAVLTAPAVSSPTPPSPPPSASVCATAGGGSTDPFRYDDDELEKARLQVKAQRIENEKRRMEKTTTAAGANSPFYQTSSESEKSPMTPGYGSSIVSPAVEPQKSPAFSPKHQPQTAYNGVVKPGFYQDMAQKSSPDKSPYMRPGSAASTHSPASAAHSPAHPPNSPQLPPAYASYYSATVAAAAAHKDPALSTAAAVKASSAAVAAQMMSPPCRPPPTRPHSSSTAPSVVPSSTALGLEQQVRPVVEEKPPGFPFKKRVQADSGIAGYQPQPQHPQHRQHQPQHPQQQPPHTQQQPQHPHQQQQQQLLHSQQQPQLSSLPATLASLGQLVTRLPGQQHKEPTAVEETGGARQLMQQKAQQLEHQVRLIQEQKMRQRLAAVAGPDPMSGDKSSAVRTSAAVIDKTSAEQQLQQLQQMQQQVAAASQSPAAGAQSPWNSNSVSYFKQMASPHMQLYHHQQQTMKAFQQQQQHHQQQQQQQQDAAVASTPSTTTSSAQSGGVTSGAAGLAGLGGLGGLGAYNPLFPGAGAYPYLLAGGQARSPQPAHQNLGAAAAQTRGAGGSAQSSHASAGAAQQLFGASRAHHQLGPDAAAYQQYYRQQGELLLQHQAGAAMMGLMGAAGGYPSGYAHLSSLRQPPAAFQPPGSGARSPFF